MALTQQKTPTSVWTRGHRESFEQSSVSNSIDRRGSHATMRFLTMQRPMLTAAVSCIARPTVNNVAPLSAQLANVLALGRRHASVKAQGAYKKKSKRGIPKKLGAKRTGGEIENLPEQLNWLPEAIDCHHADYEILTSSRPICHPRQHSLQTTRHPLVAR